MIQSDRDSLTCRVARLERQNRRLKLVVMATLLVMCMVVFLAASQPIRDELTVRALTVVDSKGKPAVKIHAPDGTGSISLWDTGLSTKPQISLGCIPRDKGGGTQIFMRNAKGDRAVNIVAQKKGNVATW